jgi:hypothetical protein
MRFLPDAIEPLPDQANGWTWLAGRSAPLTTAALGDALAQAVSVSHNAARLATP